MHRVLVLLLAPAREDRAHRVDLRALGVADLGGDRRDRGPGATVERERRHLDRLLVVGDHVLDELEVGVGDARGVARRPAARREARHGEGDRRAGEASDAVRGDHGPGWASGTGAERRDSAAV